MIVQTFVEAAGREPVETGRVSPAPLKIGRREVRLPSIRLPLLSDCSIFACMIFMLHFIQFLSLVTLSEMDDSNPSRMRLEVC